ncbi:MAG: ATP-binding cassette domain-containing protein [Spirochaetales bacterium]|nr:ATP-binding cassette domain-containing protein [Spirochaetales bacterium]
MNNEYAVRVEGISKTFHSRVKAGSLGAAFKNLFRPEMKDIQALDRVSFEVQKGDILAFIGPNGAGKSTMIKIMTGILYPDQGNVEVLGLDPHRQRRQLAYRIGTVFGQKSQLWFHLPPLDSFHLLASIYDISRRKAEDRIDELTEIFGLADFITQPVRKLSLGQRIRCEIAASLLHEPEILFLDEPSIGLDVIVKQKIRDLIKMVNRERNVTIFLTSHDAGDIEKICRNAMVINHGRLVWTGSIKEMKYKLLNTRIIDVKLDNRLKLEMPGIKLLKLRDYSAKIEVDLAENTLEAVISELVRNNSILDITVNNAPMEEVISHIYGGAV